jgi:RNA polymerase sigma-70 factor (ECF subfamily)
LLASFGHYMSNQARAAGTVRRGGLVTTVSLTTSDFRARYDREPTDHQTPELLFQRNWVASLLQGVQARLAEDYRTAGKAELFRLLEPHLTHRDDATPRAEIGRALNLSLAAIGMSLHRMRNRYGELLRQEVAATVSDPAEVEDELRSLMQIVGRTA